MKRTIAAGLSAALLCGMVVPAFAADTKPVRIVASATGTPAAATGREEANAAIRAAFGK